MSGIHCDTLVIMADSSVYKVRNLQARVSDYVLSHDIRTFRLTAGYIQDCIPEVKVRKYLRIILDDDSRLLVTPDYRIINPNNMLVTIDTLNPGDHVKLGSPMTVIPRYSEKIIREFSRESMRDYNKIDESLLEFQHSDPLNSIRIKSITAVTSDSDVAFSSLRISQYHNFAVKIKSGIIYIHE